MAWSFQRWNHILIPSTKTERDRYRLSRFGRLLGPFVWLYDALTEEGRVLAVASVVVGAFGLDVHNTEVHVLWSTLTALLVASLLLTGPYRLAGVRLEVSGPRRVSLGQAITFTATVKNDGPRDHHAVRVNGPFLPWDGTFVTPPPRLARVPVGESASVTISAKFVARGEHHLDPFAVHALVPLGLARGKGTESGGVKFIVVPKLAAVVRVSTPPGMRYQPGGVALASKTGESMDLLGVRPYRPGDPVRHLHARSSARAGLPVVREYQEEYFSRIGVVVETAVADERKLEAILSLAAGTVAYLSRGEALIDVLVVGDHVHDLTVGRHLGFLDQALDLLACVRAEKKRPDPDSLVAKLSDHLRRLSCVVVVATWDDGRLSERIRGHGVACKTLVVGDPSAAVRGRDIQWVDVDAIEKGEALAL